MSAPRPEGRFPRSARIRKRSEYLLIQSRARRVRTHHFILLVHGGSSAAEPRLGVIVSKRVGNAVVRNRAKRLAREAFRALRSEWPRGIEVVVVVRCPLQGLSLGDVVAEWQDASRQLRRRFREAEKDRESLESCLAK